METIVDRSISSTAHQLGEIFDGYKIIERIKVVEWQRFLFGGNHYLWLGVKVKND
jgi:hypothetical protein